MEQTTRLDPASEITTSFDAVQFNLKLHSVKLACKTKKHCQQKSKKLNKLKIEGKKLRKQENMSER